MGLITPSVSRLGMDTDHLDTVCEGGMAVQKARCEVRKIKKVSVMFRNLGGSELWMKKVF